MRDRKNCLTFAFTFSHFFEVSNGLSCTGYNLINSLLVLLLPPTLLVYQLFLCFRDYHVRYYLSDLVSCKAWHIPFSLTAINATFFVDLYNYFHGHALLTITLSHEQS